MATRRKALKCEPKPKRPAGQRLIAVELRLAAVERRLIRVEHAVQANTKALTSVQNGISDLSDDVAKLVDLLTPKPAVALRLIPGPVTEQRSNRA